VRIVKSAKTFATTIYREITTTLSQGTPWVAAYALASVSASATLATSFSTKSRVRPSSLTTRVTLYLLSRLLKVACTMRA